MEVPNDFCELLALFAAHRVEYLVIGGYALAHHGAPRYTGDLDLYVHPTADNSQRVLSALSDFGFGEAGLSADDFTIEGSVVQLGVEPVRVDIVTSIDGVEWNAAWEGREQGALGNASAPIIGRDALVRNKRACGRKQDLADLEALGEP